MSVCQVHVLQSLAVTRLRKLSQSVMVSKVGGHPKRVARKLKLLETQAPRDVVYRMSELDYPQYQINCRFFSIKKNKI